MHYRASLLLRTCLFLIAACLTSFAQTVSPGQEQSDPPADSSYSIKVNTTFVLVPVTVTDHQNRFVLGLDRQNFELAEDGTEQIIKEVSGEDSPLSVGLLVDTSGSMGMKLEISRRAVQEFLKTMNSSDEAFLIEFSDQAKLVSGFSSNMETVQKRLSSLRSGGLTALLDAVHMGLREMKQAKNPRKALLIISDGGDNNSRYSMTEIRELVREADIQVYSMGVFESSMMGLSVAELSGPHLLARISESTGGRVFSAGQDSDLPSIARRIGIELRNQYVLAYYPSNHDRDGKYRKIEVTLKPPDGLPPIQARWRSGYYAPNQ
ncbi:MAG: VWA domain-containing protein [Acidobacteriaceae bacterium]|nr:VWA domain-containing protein [Acidobacteriaceae bacterium]